MTLIEFFEKDAVENICTSLATAPERIIFIGDNLKLMQKHTERYKSVLTARNVNAELICRPINKNRIDSIINVLSSIVEEFDDCVFDLTGGEDLCLVAMGIVFEKYKSHNIQMHRFNLRSNTVINGDQDGETIISDNMDNIPKLTIEENIRIYGGDIVYESIEKGKTINWDMSQDFKDDINKMWDICRVAPGEWNVQIGVFAAAKQLCGKYDDDLSITVPVSEIRKVLKDINGSYVRIWRIINSLLHNGLLLSCECDDDVLSIVFKNQQIMRCLTVAGQALEMKVFLSALEAKEKDDTTTYNDVMNGVYIDWDGDIHTKQDGFDTENEIDVMMMHDMVPVFVSCKNGNIDIDELYKLNAVATRFGGKYARRVLVATSLDDSFSSKYLRQRADDMGIRLVEGYSHNGKKRRITEMNDSEINRVIRSLWSS